MIVELLLAAALAQGAAQTGKIGVTYPIDSQSEQPVMTYTTPSGRQRLTDSPFPVRYGDKIRLVCRPTEPTSTTLEYKTVQRPLEYNCTVEQPKEIPVSTGTTIIEGWRPPNSITTEEMDTLIRALRILRRVAQ